MAQIATQWRTVLSHIGARIPLSLWCTLALLCGILWTSGEASNSCGMIALMLMAELVHRLHAIPRIYGISMIIALFFIGAWRTSAEQERVVRQESILCAGPRDVLGLVTDVKEVSEKTQQITVQLERAWHSDSRHEYESIEGVFIRVEGKAFAGKPGDRIRLQRLYLRAPAHAAAKRTLHKTGILCCGKVATFANAECIPGNTWRTTQYHIRSKLIKQAYQELCPQAASLLATLFFGYPLHHSEMTLRALFEQWGISHYLARSGLHIMIVLYLIQSFFICIPLPHVLRHLCTIALSMIYTYISWPTVSFARALLTTFWYIACTQASIALHAIHIIAMVTLVTLCYQPLFLLSLDFQLSFSLTATLLCIQFLSQLVQRHTANH